MAQDLVVHRPQGLYCPPGDFYVDPWRPVPRAVITRAHADHAVFGHGHYLAAQPGEGVLRVRLGDIPLQTLAYGQAIVHRGVTISLHPAGHLLGSAQMRIEHEGQVWVVSGDYKLAPDPTCAAFEPVPCQVFITESTFGLPIYRWRPDHEIFAEINAWWARNVDHGRASVLACYSLGKAQRILAGVRFVDRTHHRPRCRGAVQSCIIVTHGNVPVMVRYLSEQGWRAESFETEYGGDAVEADAQEEGT